MKVLGYDKYEDLTTEYQVKGEFADYGVRIAKQLVAFIEVKRCTTKLSARHLRQVEMYAVNEGVEWMILTNGQVWQVWHLTPGLPVVLDMALEVDLLGDGGPTQKADTLFYLSKDAFKRRVIDELWQVKAATSAKSLTDGDHQRHGYGPDPQGTPPPDWPQHRPRRAWRAHQVERPETRGSIVLAHRRRSPLNQHATTFNCGAHRGHITVRSTPKP